MKPSTDLYVHTHIRAYIHTYIHIYKHHRPDHEAIDWFLWEFADIKKSLHIHTCTRTHTYTHTHTYIHHRPDHEAIDWFLWEYADIKKSLPPHQQPLEVIQYAGEIIYVPGGWWHTVCVHTFVRMCMHDSEYTQRRISMIKKSLPPHQQPLEFI